MDFFTQQDKARRNTGLLVLLFVVAVLMLIAITNVLVAITIFSLDGSLEVINQQSIGTLLHRVGWDQFFLIGLLVSGVVLVAILYKWFQLGEGGKRIAESLGGSRIQPNTDDLDEKRVLNVVEEMALASGMPVPPVYMLHHELGINAFAAGKTPADAVIGVTKGTASSLNRDQLQGVIAHEFSHILNGDMRLNLQLIALLHGIVFIGGVGRVLIRAGGGRRRYSSSGRRSSGNAQIAVLGIALIVIGWLGSLFGGLIRASVSRQREFLADASAVQFTRNPEGISQALKIIGGSQYGTVVDSANTEEVSHLFFGRALSNLTGLFATHPPLIERISRIEPNWDGNYMLPKPSEVEARKKLEAELEAKKQARRQQKQAVAGAIIATSMGLPVVNGDEEGTVLAAEHMLDEIPVSLHDAAREPLGAMALVLCLLKSQETTVQEKQIAMLLQHPTRGLQGQLAKFTVDVSRLNPRLRLPLLEICMPALKSISAEQYKLFKRQVMLLIQADKTIDLFEFCLFQLLRHYLDAEFAAEKPSKSKYSQAKQISESAHLVLSLLAHEGHAQQVDAEKAFNRGASSMGLYNLRLLSEEDVAVEKLGPAFRELACSQPILKAKILKAFVNAIKQDKQVTVKENELLITMAALMDSPVPSLDF